MKLLQRIVVNVSYVFPFRFPFQRLLGPVFSQHSTSEKNLTQNFFPSKPFVENVEEPTSRLRNGGAWSETPWTSHS